MDRSRRLIPAVVLAAAVAAVVLALPGATGTDGSAWIAVRCARSLLAGAGPAFTPGEALEAAPSPAWVILLAVTEVLRVPPGVALPALGLGSAAAAVVLSAWTTARLAGRLDARAGGAAVGVALAAQLAIAATTGHEAPLWAAALVLAVGIAAEPGTFAPVPAGLLVGALSFVRPEGLLVSAGLAAFGAGRPGVAEVRARWVAGCLAPGALLVAARLAWSGEPLPHAFVTRLHDPEPDGLVGGAAELAVALAAPLAALLPRSTSPRTLAALLGLALGPVGLVDPEGGGGLLACQVLGWCALASSELPRPALGGLALAAGLVWVAPETTARLAADRRGAVSPSAPLAEAVATLAPRVGPGGAFGAAEPAALGIVGAAAPAVPVVATGADLRAARAAAAAPPTILVARGEDPPTAWPEVPWIPLGSRAVSPSSGEIYSLWSSSPEIRTVAPSSESSSESSAGASSSAE